MEEETERLQAQDNPQPARTPVGFPQVKNQEKSGNKKALLIIFVLAILIVAAGWFFFGRGESQSAEEIETTPTPFEEEAKLTPEVEIDREKVKIQVLNGTGISGAAAQMKKELEDLGYSQIDAGNASGQTYTSVEVTFSDAAPDAVKEEIQDALEDIYQDIEVKTGSLDRYDIKIITGYPKGFTPTPTKKPAATSTPIPTGGVTGTITPSPTANLTSTPTPTQAP